MGIHSVSGESVSPPLPPGIRIPLHQQFIPRRLPAPLHSKLSNPSASDLQGPLPRPCGALPPESHQDFAFEPGVDSRHPVRENLRRVRLALSTAGFISIPILRLVKLDCTNLPKHLCSEGPCQSRISRRKPPIGTACER